MKEFGRPGEALGQSGGETCQRSVAVLGLLPDPEHRHSRWNPFPDQMLHSWWPIRLQLARWSN